MKKSEFLNLTRMLLASFVCLSASSPLYAAQSSESPQAQQGHDVNAVIERRMGHVTPEQRAAAAARVRAAHPGSKSRRAAARASADSAAKARVAALGDATVSDPVNTRGVRSRNKKALETAAHDAAAQEAAARVAAVS